MFNKNDKSSINIRSKKLLSAIFEVKTGSRQYMTTIMYEIKHKFLQLKKF